MRVLQQLRKMIAGGLIIPPIWEDCYPLSGNISDEEAIRQIKNITPNIEYRVVIYPEK